MIFQVPLRNDLPSYQFRTTISGAIYTLVLRYNGRMQRWIMDVNDSSNQPILSGIPVLINRDLTSQYSTLKIPPGTFFVTDDTGQGTQPTQFSFGIDHSMWYSE